MIIPRIRDLREDHDYTQAEIANLLHISQPAYSYYENGERTIPIELLIQIARIYHVSIDYLLGETNYPKRYE